MRRKRLNNQTSARVSSPEANGGGGSDLAGWLETGALFLLLMVVAMRPLLSETYESARHAIAEATATAEVTTPATTAWFDLIIWLSALGATAAAALRRVRWRWTGVEVGFVMLVLAAAISTSLASNKRLALNASCDWLTAVVLVMVVANLCRTRWRVTLMLAVLVASGASSAAKCGWQVRVELPETRVDYEQRKVEFWKKQGLLREDPQQPLTDDQSRALLDRHPQVMMYERRLEAGEAGGFFPHSNAQGAWLALAGFAAIALTGLAGGSRGRRLVLVSVAGGLACGMWGMIFVTGSRGALVATLVGIGVWIVLRAAHPTLRRRWKVVLAASWVGVVASVVGVFLIGSARGGLPGSSLAFRWNYWQVTREIITDHFWTGVGALNFDRAYLLYKPIAFPEEIDDPHNFVLSVVSQWGMAGGAGLALVLVGGSVMLARSWGQSRHAERMVQVQRDDERIVKRWLAAGAVGFVLLRLWLHRDYLFHEYGGWAYVYLDLALFGLVWVMSFVGLGWLFGCGDTMDHDRVRLACQCGIAAFLLHNMIGFAMFFPGTLTPFAVMTGVLLARPGELSSAQRLVPRRLLPVAVVALGMLILVFLTVIPVSRTMFLLARARRSDFPESKRLYLKAAQADPLDPTPPAELADCLVKTGRRDQLDVAVASVNQAIERDLDQVGLYRKKAGLLGLRYAVFGSETDLLGAFGSTRKVLTLYPFSPDDHRALADLVGGAAKARAASGLAREAIQHYEQALALDAARPGLDEVRRWPENWRLAVEREIERLRPIAASRPGP